MNKYTPFADHLRNLSDNSVQFTFAQIDSLVDGLPPSARRYDAWWANSRTRDTHTWAHLWIAAGWECKGVDRMAETVVFQRSATAFEVPTLRYWWVNHKQTFKAEFEGGYLWSPQANQNGARNQTYDNLTYVQSGDIVVSYAGAQVKALGVAKGRSTESSKPEAFGQAGSGWSNNGWLVPIEWTALPVPLLPKVHLHRIRPLLPSKHSPLQGNGNGNQSCYLAAISADLGQLILDLIAENNAETLPSIDAIEQQIEADEKEGEIQSTATLSQTQREQLINARRGQGQFRQNVLKVSRGCPLTGVEDQNFLIASHIKPWKDSDNTERLDGHNGLMLAPHIDRLFDRGWISFDNQGRLLATTEVLPILQAWKIDGHRAAVRLTSTQKVYMAYHRRMVFKGQIG